MKILFLTTFFFSSYLLSCELETYRYIIKTQIEDSYLIKKSNCSKKIINEINQHLNSLEGEIPNYVLEKKIKNNIKIFPTLISIRNLKEVIQENLDSQSIIKNLKEFSYQKDIYYDKKTQLRLSCSECDKTGDKTVKIELVRKDRKDVYFFDVKLAKLKYALVPNKNLRYGASLQKRDFQKKLLPLADDQVPFLSLEELNHYQLNGSLNMGKPLLQNKIRSKRLIKYGSLVTCELNKNGIQLSGKGIARNNGKYLETITLMHPKSKRLFTGTIIGTNKVKIEI